MYLYKWHHIYKQKITEDEKIYSDFNNGLDKKKVKLKYITSKFITITLEKMI